MKIELNIREVRMIIDCLFANMEDSGYLEGNQEAEVLLNKLENSLPDAEGKEKE